MIKFTFNTLEIERTVHGIERFCDDVPEIAGSEVVRQVREFAGSSRSPNGTQWPPLSKEYAKKKKAKGGLPIANKLLTGGFLASVKNRDGVIYVDSIHAKIAESLERLRISFQVSPLTPGNVERLLLKRWNEI